MRMASRGVAQSGTLLYRRMAFGCGFAVVRRVRTAEALRITNPRHGRLPVCATPANRASSFGDAPQGASAIMLVLRGTRIQHTICRQQKSHGIANAVKPERA